MAHAADPRKHVHVDTLLGAVLSVWDFHRLFLGCVWRVGSARFLHACAQGHVFRWCYPCSGLASIVFGWQLACRECAFRA